MRNLLDAELIGTLDVSALTNKAEVRIDLGITSGSVAIDTIWDAAGDILVGTGPDTAARLAKGTALQVLRVNAGGTTLEYATVTGVPGGSDTQIQFNDSETFGGDSGFTYNKTTDVLTVSNATLSGTLTTLDLNAGNVEVSASFLVNGANAEVTLTPTGASTVTISPSTVGAINRMNIGATVPGTGAFTTLSTTGVITLPDNIRQTFNPGATVAGLNVGSLAGDPSTPINGDLWYDSTANALEARIDGTTVILGPLDPPPPPFDPASPGPIGGTAPGTGAFTTLSATSSISGSTRVIAGTDVIIGNDNNVTRFLQFGANRTFLTSPVDGQLTLSSDAGLAVTLSIEAAATLQMGVDAAAGVNQKLKAMDATAGTGGNLTLSPGTGTVAGGALIFQTAATGTLTTKLTLPAADTILANVPFVLKNYTVATLPSTAATGMVQGAMAFVTDALTPTFLTAAVGGGAVVAPCFYNGSAWVTA